MLRLTLHPFTLAALLLVAAGVLCLAIGSHIARERALMQVDLLLDCALLAGPEAGEDHE